MAHSSIRVFAVMVRSADAGRSLSERQEKRLTGTRIVEDRERQPQGVRNGPFTSVAVSP